MDEVAENKQAVLREAIQLFWQAQGARNKNIEAAENRKSNNLEILSNEIRNRKEKLKNTFEKHQNEHKKIQSSLDAVGLSYPKTSTESQEKSFNGDAEVEFFRLAKNAEELALSIHTQVDELTKSIESMKTKRTNSILLGLVTIILLLVLILGFWLPGRKEKQTLQDYYDLGKSKLAEQDWISARSNFQAILKVDNNYKDTRLLLNDSYYQPSLSAYEEGLWGVACENIQGVSSKYKDSERILLESCYQEAINYIKSQDWGNAKRLLNIVIAVNPTYKDVERKLFDVTLQVGGNYIKGLKLQSPELNVTSPNTHMELFQLLVRGTDETVILDLSIVVESGNGAKIYKPDAVFLSTTNGKIYATGWDGVFGNESSIGELSLGGKGDKEDGRVLFSNSLNPVLESGCVDFHYGEYYIIENICLP